MPLGEDQYPGLFSHSLGSWASIVLPSLVAMVCLQYGLFREEDRGLRLDEPGRLAFILNRVQEGQIAAFLELHIEAEPNCP
jgi:hypothetical protein